MVKDIVLTATGFSVGAAIVSGFYHLRGIRQEHWRIWYVLSRWGFAIAFSLLLEAVLKAPFIAGEWRAWVFIVSCVITGVGLLGVMMHDRDIHKNPDRGRYL